MSLALGFEYTRTHPLPSPLPIALRLHHKTAVDTATLRAAATKALRAGGNAVRETDIQIYIEVGIQTEF